MSNKDEEPQEQGQQEPVLPESYYTDLKRRIDLVHEVNAHRDAIEIRKYVGEVLASPAGRKEHSVEVEGNRDEWVAWALRAADLIDPLA